MVEVKLHVTTTQSSPYPSDEISVQCLSMMALCSIPKFHRCSLASWNELLMPSSSYLDSNWKWTNSLGCTGRYVCFESGSDANLWTMISFWADSFRHQTGNWEMNASGEWDINSAYLSLCRVRWKKPVKFARALHRDSVPLSVMFPLVIYWINEANLHNFANSIWTIITICSTSTVTLAVIFGEIIFLF